VLARLIEPIETATLGGLGDRALLLLGFAAALRPEKERGSRCHTRARVKQMRRSRASPRRRVAASV
jgi:hypothetical protein